MEELKTNGLTSSAFSWITVIKIAGAFVALIIGSGFATGQEVMQFFAAYGFKGVLGGLITLGIFIYLVYTFMKLGKEQGITKNEDVFKYYCGKYLGTAITWYVMTFMIAVIAIMLAGAGATLAQSYGMPISVGSGIMTLFAVVTILLGLNKLVDIIGVIGPGIIILTLFIAIATIIKNPAGIAEGNAIVDSLEIYKASSSWWVSGILYIGLNILGLASFLPSVGKTVSSDKELKYSAILGPILFVAALVLVALALLSNIESVINVGVPILTLADKVLPVYGSVFAVVISLGIYTTVTPYLWSVISRFSEEKTKKYVILTLVLGLVVFLGGNVLPFGKLVNLIYPSIGYVGTIFLAAVVIKDVRTKYFAK